MLIETDRIRIIPKLGLHNISILELRFTKISNICDRFNHQIKKYTQISTTDILFRIRKYFIMLDIIFSFVYGTD